MEFLSLYGYSVQILSMILKASLNLFSRIEGQRLGQVSTSYPCSKFHANGHESGIDRLDASHLSVADLLLLR